MNLDKTEAKLNISTNIVSSEQKLNKIQRRFINLSPTVDLGLERECTKFDFLRDGDKPIGRGGFGEVWKVVHRDTNKSYCIKIVDKREMIEQRLINQLNTELEIMYEIHHPHSIKLINHFEDEDKFYIIMNFASKGTVFNYMKDNHKLDQRTAAQFIRETLSIIKYLHSFNPKIIHRDIKPENLLLDENLRIKLCDYGWACYQEEGVKIKTFCGTPEYVSPEMVKKQGHDYRVDTWSIGVLLFEMLAGYTPFLGKTNEDLFNNITKIKINWPNDFPTLAKNLILKIFKYDPNERPSLEEIGNHPWFEQNPNIKEEIIYPKLSKKEILLSHIINDLSKQESIDSSKRDLEQLGINGLDFVKKKSNNKQITDDDLYLIPNDKEKMKNEIKSLKIQVINTDNIYQEVLKENKRLLQIEKEFEDLKEDFSSLTKELELYKLREKDREALIDENEHKANLIILLREELTNCKLERVSLDCLIKQINSMTTLVQLKDSIISDLKDQISNFSKGHNKTIVESNNIDKSNETFQESKIEMKDVGVLIEKISAQLNDKAIGLNKRIEASFSIYETKERQLSTVIKHIANEITIVISIVKESMIQNINDLFGKFSFKSIKTLQTIAWLNENIQRLQEFKGKSERLEKKMEASDEEVKILKRQIEVLTLNEQANLKLINSLKDICNIKDRKMSNLEAKICDIKNFMFKNCNNDVLESFFDYFKGTI